MEGVVDGNGGGCRLVMTELSHIKELVKQLDVHLGGCPDFCKNLAAQISTVTERSISMIRSGHFDGRKRSAAGAGIDSPAFPSTPSPLGGVSNMHFKANKKRKMMEKGNLRVKVGSASGGGDAPEDDGYSWRKYGQKEILGSQNRRAYYRCTHQKTQGCAATKQVQRADEDATLFDVTYHGTHTCGHKTAAAANVQPATPNPDASGLLKSLSSGLTVNTEGLTPGPRQDWNRTTPFSFSPAVSGLLTPENCFDKGVSVSSCRLELSPATSGSSENPMNPFEEEWSAQSELVSALVTAMSMPQPAMEVEDANFSLDELELFDDSIFDVSILDYLPCLR